MNRLVHTLYLTVLFNLQTDVSNIYYIISRVSEDRKNRLDSKNQTISD